MTALVKICGLQSVSVLEQALEAPIDYIGFVFAASKRKVTMEQAAEMISAVKQRAGRVPEFVGVFVDPDQNKLQQVLDRVPLQYVQLHGNETPQLCRWVKDAYNVKVIKVIPVTEALTLETMSSRLDAYAEVIDTLMLDTYDPHYGGGSGKTFRWELIPHFRDWTRSQGIPLLIAGGLNEENVKQLLDEYEPDGVDVSSGVETNGAKDLNKIYAFVERVKAQ